MTDENLDKKVHELARKVKHAFLRVEIVIGILAVICGTVVSIMVWSEGYFAGAIMMVVTGLLNIFLAIKELVDPSDGIFHWQAYFFMIVRRAMFFLNVVLLALVVGTMTQLI